MTTTTSYSDSGRFKAVYRSALRRSMGYFGLITALLFIFYPFQYALRVFRTLTEYQKSQLAAGADLVDIFDLYGLGLQFTPISMLFYTAIVLVIPVVLALVLNSYMHSKKAADVYHSLPVKRETLLGIHTAVAMTIITIPVLASNLLVILFQTIKFGFHPFLVRQILLDMVGWLVCALFIYLLTTTVCVLVGTVFDTFIFSGILMAAVPIIVALYTGLAGIFLFGFDPNNFIRMRFLLILSPITLMPARMSFSGYVTGSGFRMLIAQDRSLLFHSTLAILIYLLLSVLLLIAAMRLYRRRNSEMAETTTSKGILQVVIKFLGTWIGGVSIGLIFYEVNSQGSLPSNMTFVMWSLIGGMLTYIIIEAVLNRGFKSFVKSLPLGVLMVAVMSISTLAVLLGGFGYENRVPDAGNVDSLEISYMGRFNNYSQILESDAGLQGQIEGSHYYTADSVRLADPENIAAVIDYHQDVVNTKYRRTENWMAEGKATYGDTVITYHLKNGKTMCRTYHLVLNDTLLKLAPIETSAEFLTQTQPVFFTDPKNIEKWTITDPFGGHKIEQLYSEQDSAALLEAMKADLLNQTSEELLHPTDTILAVVQYHAVMPEEAGERWANRAYFYVTNEQQRTWQILKDKGIADSLKPDLSKCTAVSTEYPYRIFRDAIYQLSPDDDFQYSELEDIRQHLSEMETNMSASDWEYYDEAYAKNYYGVGVRLYEDQGLIEQMAQQVVATGSINEPMVILRFFFEDVEEGTLVAVPLSSLPQNVQLELKSST